MAIMGWVSFKRKKITSSKKLVQASTTHIAKSQRPAPARIYIPVMDVDVQLDQDDLDALALEMAVRPGVIRAYVAAEHRWL
jgi:hypothetical protein